MFSSVDVPSLSYPSLLFLWLVASVSVLCSLVLVSVSALLLCLSAYVSLPYFGVFFGVFFVAVSTSVLSVLLGQCPCGFSSYPPLLPRSDLNSFATGSPFGTSQLLWLVPSPPSPDPLVGLCTLLPSFHCRSQSISLPLLFWPSASSSSLPLLCAIFWYVAALGCVCHGLLSSYMGSFLCLCLSCSSHCCVLGGFSTFGGGSHGFLWFPLCFPFIRMHLLSFLHYYVISLFRTLSFSLGVSASEVGFTRLSPLVIICHHRCCTCGAVWPGTLLLRLPPL